MSLFLVQHGKNLPKDIDPEKGLSEEGKRDVERVANEAKDNGIKVSAIRHSGKKRARETAHIFSDVLKLFFHINFINDNIFFVNIRRIKKNVFKKVFH